MTEHADTNRIIKLYRLSEITNQIKDKLLDLSKSQFWIKAHLLIRPGAFKGGHFYCELIDVDEKGAQLAKIRSTIWSSDYIAITHKLKAAGCPDALKDNSEVCVLCAVRYHALYGLSLNIVDIDPDFGESQIDRNRRLIIEKLTAEGIVKNNTEAFLTAAVLNIGLITSNGSASFNDFVKTLSASKFSFKIVLADSTMQGVKTENDVITSIKLLLKTRLDVICIVRGGGSQTDLAWFDNENIAREIIKCPIPVWVGIGHEIDKGVLDVVAHSSFKTPTAVAEELVTRLQELLNRINVDRERLISSVERQLLLTRQSLLRNIEGAAQGFRKYINFKQELFAKNLLKADSLFFRELTQRENSLLIKKTHFHHEVSALLKKKEANINQRNETLVRIYSTCIRDTKRRIADKTGRFIFTGRQYMALRAAAMGKINDRCQKDRFLRILDGREQNLEEKMLRFNNLKPENILKKGYTITEDAGGNVIKSIDALKPGDLVLTRFIDGSAKSLIKSKEGEN